MLVEDMQKKDQTKCPMYGLMSGYMDFLFEITR